MELTPARRASSRRLAPLAAAVTLLLVPSASALTPASDIASAPLTLMPGVTDVQHTELTPFGPVVYTVITSPAPTQAGLIQIGPVLSGNTIGAPRAPLTQIEQSVGAAVTAGVTGDFLNATGSLSGLVIVGGALERAPTPARASIGFDSNGTMHVGRISLSGTWQGSGPRRPVALVNATPQASQTVLFTPAWGTVTPNLPNATAVTLEPFPRAAVNADLTAPATAIQQGATPIPADGAVLVSTGTEAAKLQAEAASGTNVTVRLALPDSWSNVVSALGGGPQLVKQGRPVFGTGESFVSSYLTSRQPRAAVGQLANGSVILVAVDGGRSGYSVGMTTYELAKTMAKLGAVTAAGLQYGKEVAAAFDGQLLDRPDASTPVGLKEALLVQYAGVTAPAPSPAAMSSAGQAVKLSYRLVQPATVTASVIGPDGVSHVVDSGSRAPGSYPFTWTALDHEGAWHWHVEATDAGGHTSTVDETFTYDLTLSRLTAAQTGATLEVGVTLTRSATASLSITAANGTVVATLPAGASLAAGAQTLSWDGLTDTGTPASGARAPSGSYVAVVTVTSAVGSRTGQVAFRWHS